MADKEIKLDIMKDLYSEKIAAAESGDTEAAKWLIEEFTNSVRNGLDDDGNLQKVPNGNPILNNLSIELLIYFSRCFEDYLAKDEDKEQIDISKALHLKKKTAGRPGGYKNKNRDIRILQNIQRLIDKGHLVNEAIKIIAEEECKSSDTIKDIYKRLSDQIIIDKLLRKLEQGGN